MTDHGVGSWPARRARITPDAVALRQGDRALTYAELAGRVDALAAGLAALGVSTKDRVAYLGANDIATFETFFAAGRLGAIFVPLNTRLTPVELGQLLADCAPTVLVHGPEVADVVAVAFPGGRTLPITDFPLPAATPAPAEVGLDDPALLLYTSGTTGRAKGAVLTHGNLTWNTMNQLAHVDILSTDVVLCTAPLFHVTGLGQVSLPALFKGGTVVVAPRFDPGWMLGVIPQFQINGFSAVPTMLQMLCDHPQWADADLSSLRYVIYGGSTIQERVASTWLSRGVQVLQGYGMTEAAPGVFMATPAGAAQRPISAGVTHFFTDVELLATDGTRQPLPGTGELLVSGPNVFAGYWNRPDDTAASFVDGAWFRSGDVVRVDPDGWAYVVDRVKDMIISGGENIYPAEVEAVINQLPEVDDCAVVAVPDPKWGEVGLAFVVLRSGAELDDEALRAHLDGRLARYKIPRQVRFVTDLPRTATGKVRRADLRAVAAPPPSDEQQETR
jgi:fatty-acyl-CoA synthase